MDKRINRFILCDSRFHPYLRKVIERLPEEVKDDFLNDKGFQILSDEDVFNKCTVYFEFDKPVETILYLNTKILMEAEHCITYLIGHEIAHYVLRKEDVSFGEKEVEELLLLWGFENEVNAIHYDKEVARSETYRTGYDWAKKQSQDYLMQHFGMYFDEWNEKGLGSINSERLDVPHHETLGESILDEVMRLKGDVYVEPKNTKAPETLSLRKAMLAGVMAAVKELNLSKFDCLENYPSRRSANK